MNEMYIEENKAFEERIAFKDFDRAFKVAADLIEEGYVVLVYREEMHLIVAYEWTKDGSPNCLELYTFL